MFKLKAILYLKKIFYIKETYEDNKFYFLINFLGIRIKLRNHNKETDILKNKIMYLSQRVDTLENANRLIYTLFEKSIDITCVPKAKGNLRKIQLIKAKLLGIVSYILKKNNMPFWLDYGTLIGAIRHKGFVPWDDDIDISLLKEDYIRLPIVFNELSKINENFKYTYHFYNDLISRFFYKQYCVDFFPYEYINENYQTSDTKIRFADKWHKIHNSFFVKYPKDDFYNDKIKTTDVLEQIDEIKKEILGENYKSNPASKQIIYCPEYNYPYKKYPILNVENIFPLKETQWEDLTLTIPNDPVQYLYEQGIYGGYGDVLKFPKITDYGFVHTQINYEDSDIDFDTIYNELSELEDKIKNS